MNGVYLRNLQPDEYAHDLCKWLGEQGIEWPVERVRATVPLVQEKIEKFSQYPDFVRFLFEPVVPPEGVDPEICRAAAERLAAVEPWEATAIEEALRGTGRGARAEAARGVRPDPARGHGLEGLAGALREHRAARPRGEPRAAQRGRGRLSGRGWASGSSAR